MKEFKVQPVVVFQAANAWVTPRPPPPPPAAASDATDQYSTEWLYCTTEQNEKEEAEFQICKKKINHFNQ